LKADLSTDTPQEVFCVPEDAMKKIGAKLAYVTLGILSFLGIWPASATTIPQQPVKSIDEVKNTTPLYLQLGADLQSKMSKEKDLTLAQHWQHYSHRNHSSHWAHYAHRAHYSHYDSYR
jgi:hypothetical protein